MNKINRQELAVAIHENAVTKGFWDVHNLPEHYLALVISELGEAIEADRNGIPCSLEPYHSTLKAMGDEAMPEAFRTYIKDSFQDEIADAYIRLLDMAEGFAYQYDESVITDFYKSIIENARTTAESIYYAMSDVIYSRDIEDVSLPLTVLEVIAEKHGFDLDWHIREKMKYNASRERLHGKNY